MPPSQILNLLASRRSKQSYAVTRRLLSSSARPNGRRPPRKLSWVVTRTHSRRVRSALDTSAPQREVTALRCGLDAAAWYGAGAMKCADRLGIGLDKAPAPSAPLPFDQHRAYTLYKALFGEVEDLIAGKHLLVVPSVPQTQLPFQVLVTVAPASGDHRAQAWLARNHAVTVLPTVSSLKTLRRAAKPSTATRR